MNAQPAVRPAAAPLQKAALAVVALVLVVLVAKQLGGLAGASAAANDLAVGGKIVDEIRPHLDVVLQQARRRHPYMNPENWSGSRPSANSQLSHFTAKQIRDYASREVYEIASGLQHSLAGGDPYREAAFILGNWARTHR
jgi:hypothetical protein